MALSLFQEVLKHLQGKLEQEARVMVSSGQTEVLDQLKGACPGWGGGVSARPPLTLLPLSPALQMDITSLYNLKFPPEVSGSGRSAEDNPLPPAPQRDSSGDLGRATFRMLEELDRER